MNKLIFFILILSINTAASQSRNKILEVSNKVIQNNWNNFFEMLSIPNDGYDSPNIEKNIIWWKRPSQI